MQYIEKPAPVHPEDFMAEAAPHEYINDLGVIDASDSEKMLNVGVDLEETARAGTFIQKDNSVIHCKAEVNGVEIMGIQEALREKAWLSEYLWTAISADKDEFTAHARRMPEQGYFIRSLPGAKITDPVQSCLYIAKEGFAQNVHNIVIAEEGSDIHIITGCATSPHLESGLHVGVSEFFVKKNARLTFTMIHDWGKTVSVRPSSVTHVEEGGVLISNYISLKPVGSLEMFPTTILRGKGAVARFNSVLVAGEGSYLDVGSRVVLDAPDTRAEIISRGVSAGGAIIARGDLVGKHPGVRAHLECKGLILDNGLLHAVPELQGHVPDVEMSHEAAVGKIDRQEIEYLMARGLDENEAVSTIVRGFLNVDIEGLPPRLQEQLNRAVEETQADMM